MLATGALVGPTGQSAAAGLVTCAPGVDTFTWDGGAGTHNWMDGNNWDVNCPPIEPEDVVTIPAGNSVIFRDGESATIASLHNAGTLTVTTGAWFTTLHRSVSHTLILRGGYSGRGSLKVTSLLKWVSTSTGASTQATRRCPAIGVPPTPFQEDCTSPVSGRLGRTVIASGARMTITGRGVNLTDQRVIENHGTVTLANQRSYIAADDGTTFRNVRNEATTGRFVIRNDNGYYQGFTASDLGWSVGQSRFVNTGTVTKTAGNGLSIIAADYTRNDPGSRYTGHVDVLSGSLSILTPDGGRQTRTARVDAGSRFGNGGVPATCDPTTGACSRINPTPDDPQVTTVQVTKRVHVKRPTQVSIRELRSGLRAPVDIATPTAASDGAVSLSRPLRFRIYMQLGSGDASPSATARLAKVFRNNVRLPNCDQASQNPTRARPSCVARRLSRAETADLAGKDVVLVISSTQNSRYRVGT